MCAESSHVDSGFGNYTRNILSRLHNSGKYEIAELSCYRTAQVPKKEPWKIYPNVPKDPEALQKYNSNPGNAFGSWGFDAACVDFKPDIVFDVRDYWMLNFVESSMLRPYFHWFVAPTIDSAPQKNDWIKTFSNADTVSGHTQWGIDYLKSTGTPMNLVDPVNDAVDIELFDISSQNKESIKSSLGLNPKDFIVGSVMRNQKRKLIPNLIKIIKEISKTQPNIKLYLHTSFPDLNGWELASILLEHDALDLVYVTYRCQKCKKFFARNFCDSVTGCHFCQNKTATICNVSNGVQDSELCQIFNSFDLYVQYAICEGFGIPPVEAAACGVPVLTVDHGAMREVGENIGATILPVQTVFRELETNADRVYPDDQACIDTILEKYNEISKMSFSQKLEQKENIRNKLISSYSWDKTAKKFEEIFDNIELTGLQGKWDSPLSLPKTDLKVPPLPSNRHVINFIIDHIVGAPWVKNIASIQSMIKAVDIGYMNIGGKVNKFTMEQAVKSLENLMNTKYAWEMARHDKTKFPEIMKSVIDY